MPPIINRFPMGSSEFYKYSGDSLFIDDGNGNWRIKFLTSGTLKFSKPMTIDAFLVGGGASGGYHYSQNATGRSGGGGGGGYTLTQTGISVDNTTSYQIEVGEGGAAGGGSTSDYGRDGGTTSAFDLTAAGGKSKGAYGYEDGGNGGSGGGEYGYDGGSDGADGIGIASNPAGIGQGSTTREFGSPIGTLYSGGGGGGQWIRSDGVINGPGNGGAGGGGDGASTTRDAISGLPNSGGGGGGGICKTNGNKPSGGGGSGIVVIRNARG